MTNELTRRGLLGAGVLGVSAAAAGVLGFGPTRRERNEISRDVQFDGGSLTATTDNGDVTISRTDGDAVQIRAVETASWFASLDQVSLDVTKGDGRLSIVGESEDVLFGSAGLSLDIGVPAGVEVETVEANNGDATVRNVDGYVSLAAKNGDVRASGVTGVESAETKNGDVDVTVPDVQSDVSIRATNGDVSAALTQSLDATVLARATNGDVTNDGLSFESMETGGNRIRGTLGEGTHDVTLETENGDVSLRVLN